MARFPERLKKLRVERKIMQKDIASYLGVTPRNIQRYENGDRSPDFERLVALSRYFQTSADWLLGISDDPTIHDPSDPFGEDAAALEQAAM